MSTLQADPTTTGRDDSDRTPVTRSTPRAPWTLVMAREIHVRLTDKTFLLSTLFTVLLILGAMVVPMLLDGGAQERTVAVLDDAGATLVERAEPAIVGSPSLTGDGEVTVETTRAADRAAAEQLVLDGDVDLALVGGPGDWEVLSDGAPDGAVLGAISETVRAETLEANAATAGTTVEALTTGSEVAVTDLAASEEGMAEGVRYAIGFGFAFVFYMAAIMFGMQIASSVVEEKQSRIVEILAAAIPVRHLLLGKVLGNTLLAVGQMALIVAATLVGMTFTNLDVALPGLAGALGWYLPFFLLGFLALACIWAAAGAIASRTEDLQSSTMPLMMVLVIAILGSTYLEGVWREIGSFVPILSTLLMPMRILEGEVSWWEPTLALLVVAAFSGLTILLGSRLYQRALLHTSGSLSWRRAFQLGE